MVEERTRDLRSSHGRSQGWIVMINSFKNIPFTLGGMFGMEFSINGKDFEEVSEMIMIKELTTSYYLQAPFVGGLL